MKTKRIAIILVLMIGSFSGFSQKTMSSFFKYEGVKTFANLAHPTSTFHTGSYDLNGDRIKIKIVYTDGNKI